MQKSEIKNKIEKRRWIKRVNRKNKKYNPKGDELVRFDRKIGHQYKSKILDLYGIPYIPFKKRSKSEEKYFKVPKIFSISKNPKQTLRLYQDLVAYVRNTRTPRILLDHRQVEEMGLAADAVLGVLMKEISRECSKRRGYSMRGWKADNPEVRKMMDKIGCVRVMEDDYFASVGTEAEKISVNLRKQEDVFRIRNGGSFESAGIGMDRKSIAGKDFADHVDSCLSKVNKKLSPVGKSDLLQYFTEIVDNATEHSGLDEWVACGYLDVEDSDLVYRCTIVSFGETFSSTFESLNEDSNAYDEVGQYVSLHQRKNLFTDSWRQQDLVAVMALQADVSSKNIDDNSTRGQGTVEFIEFFQSIRETCEGDIDKAIMAIITGQTEIVFDGTYQMKEISRGGRKVLAFNARNDLSSPPDAHCVKALSGKYFFPGVVISIAAPLASSVVEV